MYNIQKYLVYIKSLLVVLLLKLFHKNIDIPLVSDISWLSKIRISNSTKYLKIGKRVKISPKVELNINDSFVKLGDDVVIMPYSFIQVGNAKLTISNKVFINRGCTIVCMDNISIGENTAIGNNCSFFDHDHVTKKNSTQNWGDSKTDPIVIEDNVWIGANVTVLKGSHIGHNSVIGAGSVIKGNIPPNSIVYLKKEYVIKEIL